MRWWCFLFASVMVLALPGRALEVRAAVPWAPGGCAGGLLLPLQPGLHTVGGALVGSPPPADLPPERVSVTLPLYPGAAVSTQALPYGGVTSYPTPYVESAAAEYAIVADKTVAMAWYTRAFRACGYTASGFGSGGGATGAYSFWEFLLGADPNVHVEMDFFPGSGGMLYLLYEVIRIAMPSRPAASYLTGRYRAVHIQFRDNRVGYVGVKAPVQITLTIRNRNQIALLQNTINGESQLVPFPLSCGGFGDRDATLQFVPRRGGAVLVSASCGGVQIGSYPVLQDQNGAVWLAIEAVLLEHCKKRPCLSLG